jgi:gas vesicle protein
VDLKGAGRWGIAAAIGAVGAASAILLNPRTGPVSRDKVRQAGAVVRRERAHILALAGVGRSKAETSAGSTPEDAEDLTRE